MIVKYSENMDKAEINNQSFRRDKKTGYYLSSRKINGPRKGLHVYVWELFNGKVPEGYDVHHIDGNKKNNEIENLEILNRSDHAKEHGRRLTDEQREERAERLRKMAVPKAVEWHKSKEGRKWHSNHGKEVAMNRPFIDYECDYCGKPFKSKRIYSITDNKFCCNNCRSSYRRKSGVDDIEKVCVNCGSKYIANKYSNTKYCKNCKDRKNRIRSCIQHGSER